MKKIIILMTLILLVCSSCKIRTSESVAPTPSETTTSPITSVQSPSATPEKQQESPALVDLPLPTSKMFPLEGVDAVLYDAAVALYSTLSLEPDMRMHLLMPSLGFLDSYTTDDGSTCYLCWFRQWDYYDLGYGLSDLDNPQYNFGGGYKLARFTVSTGNSGEFICNDIFTSQDGEGWAYSIRQICGPKEELATAIINNEKLPVEFRNITTNDETEILNIYLDYYFR